MLTNAELGKMLEDCQKSDDASSEILRAVESIARRNLNFQQNIPRIDCDDIIQNLLIRFWKKLKNNKLNKQKNINGYILAMLRTEVFASKRKYTIRKKNNYAYAKKHQTREILPDYR